MEGLCTSGVVVDSFLSSLVELLVTETAAFAVKSLACSLLMMKSMHGGLIVLPKEQYAPGSFPTAHLHEIKKPAPENTDGSETEDDDDDNDANDQDDDDEDAAEDEEDNSEDGEEESDPEDEPVVNGGAGSGDDDEDEDDEDEDEDVEDEDDEDEEDLPQPPTKKRK